MGAALSEIDAWLCKDGLIVTANERAARALATGFDRRRQAEGRKAWAAPRIVDWTGFLRGAWAEHAQEPRLVLNPIQEQSLWAEIVGGGNQLATLLPGPRHRLAALAVEAHRLLASHAPEFLRSGSRAGWAGDAAAFSGWLSEFDERCRADGLLSAARLPLELISLLEHDVATRPPLLLIGFDRMQPVQRTLLDAWGEWSESARDEAATAIGFHQAVSEEQELEACALWCNQKLAVNRDARILIVSQKAARQRGQMERALLRHVGPVFEFSLGIPLSQVAVARGAQLLLSWLTGSVAEHELDWLFSTGLAAATAEEVSALQARMRALRSRGLEQPSWTLDAFLAPFVGPAAPEAWAARMAEASRRLTELARRPQSPLEWAEELPRLLETLQFSAAAPLASAEFQALDGLRSALETTGSLGFDGRRVDWREFLSAFARTLDETLFSPESREAPILIAGPAESAGLTADAIWFLGATEQAWPAAGLTHPLLPAHLQREAQMPHGSAQLDWELAQSITTRLLGSAAEIHFSFAHQVEGAEARPSRLILPLAQPQLLAEELKPQQAPPPLTCEVEDFSRIAFPTGHLHGGSAVLTAQSQCPFKAFATARLDAKTWQPAQAGLTPSQRGQLLHSVMHNLWAGPPSGIRTLNELTNLKDRAGFVTAHVHRVFEEEIRPQLRERMPRRYLELEAERVIRLVSEWLAYESARIAFEVVETEAACTQTIAGLTLDLRLDRVDRLNDGSLLVVDYKTGNVSPRAWEPPRPEDVQLPLYAGFALTEEEVLGGLVFAKVRAGEMGFAGRVGDATATLFAGLKPTQALVSNPYQAEDLIAWRETVTQLAKDFLAGRAEVDPRDPPETCKRCGLQTLCRIHENGVAVDDEDSGVEVADDE
jgi:probable DNA repair protein